ncbi:MAG: GspE/PulE family protein [Planctomycetaceae bacterium]|nr:GspE/PulE family protein [Planctomycetaceae bacterium]
MDLSRTVATREALQAVPPQLARRLGVLPVMIADGQLYIVMADESDDSALSQFEAQMTMPVVVLHARAPEAVASVIRRYYPEQSGGYDGTSLGLLGEIVRRAMLYRCSDIHFDAESKTGLIRLRIDGLLRTDRVLPHETLNELISAVKVSSGLDMAERRVPQDGQLTMLIAGEEISMRVATIPTLHGEKLTLRILATESIAAELADLNMLGMSGAHHRLLLEALGNSHGVILLSGPTGSGKTTTLYASLRHLKEPGTLHILSIEDPVEIPLDGINQIRIDSDRVSFNRALRSTLRHDPDVIMIGEIRDAETADIAIKSALTGHLVLSTLHANDSVGVITRLLNLGVSVDLVNSALRLVIAQRLVRCPCPHCMTWTPATEADCEFFGWGADDRKIMLPRAAGCQLCHDTGYAGRLGLYEMIPVDRTIRDMIRSGESEDHISHYLFKECQIVTLRADGAEKVLKGLTTIDEVQRVTCLLRSA